MLLLRFLLPTALVCLVFSITITTTARSEPGSLWQHNNSVMALYADGMARQFRYQEPRIGLQQEGVTAGTQLFSGTKSGNTYTGVAYVFSRRCGAHSYHVSGMSSPDGREVVMQGNAPAAFDATCRPILYRQDVLVFTFLQSLAPPAPPQVAGWIDRNHVAEQEAIERLRRERADEERRLAELRTFAAQRTACSRYDIEACDAALRSPHAAIQEMGDLSRWRRVADDFRVNRQECRLGSVEACDAALRSPAMRDADHPSLLQWRSTASPFTLAAAAVAFYVDMVATTAIDAAVVVRNLPTSTHVAGGMAAVLALALAGITLRQRKGASPGDAGEGTVLEAEAPPAVAGSPQRQHNAQPDATPASPFPLPKGPPPIPQAPSSPPSVRDTPGAIAALELAYAYLIEVRDADRPAFDDTDTRKRHLNTLALAAKQLDAAQGLDPDAVLEGQDQRDIPFRFSGNELKAEALVLEGTTHQTYDTKRAIPALLKATEVDPNNASAFYILGLVHAANMNKRDALAAFERAVALDPQNIAYRKELNRVQNLSAGEIAAYKATRAGERIFDAGVATANAGIMTWNIFAVIWNIVTFPLRVVFGIFRLLRLFPFG